MTVWFLLNASKTNPEFLPEEWKRKTVFSFLDNFTLIYVLWNPVCACMLSHVWLLDLQPARLLCPWNSPGKNTGLGCHFPLQGNLPDPTIKPASLAFPALAGGFFTTAPPASRGIRKIIQNSLSSVSCIFQISWKWLFSTPAGESLGLP